METSLKRKPENFLNRNEEDTKMTKIQEREKNEKWRQTCEEKLGKFTNKNEEDNKMVEIKKER